MAGRIPVVVELLRRRVHVPSISCHLCDSGIEATDRVLINCTFAKSVPEGVLKWCDIPFSHFTNVGELINFAASWGN